MAALASNAPDHRSFWQATREDFGLLLRGPKALWVIFLVKFLESVAHFAIYNVLVVYMSEDLHYGDESAGAITGFWLTLVSLVMFFSGFIADALGIRRAMLGAVASCLIGRLVLVAGLNHPVVPLIGLFTTTWGVAALLPTMTAAVRQYTNARTVAFGFSLFYVIMNVGAFVAPQTVSFFRTHFKGGVNLDFLGGVHLTSSQALFALATAVTLLGALATLLLPDDAPGGSAQHGRASRSPIDIVKEIGRDRQFYGFMLFVTLLVFVRLIFQHAHQTWPKYTLREVSPDFDFAWYWSLNPLLVIVLTPAVTAITKHFSAFWSIVVGSFVSALSVFFLVISSDVPFQIAFVATLSVGECIWSPRLYEYTSTIAAPGREASYMGLSQVPMFLAKPVVGWTSGLMLATWCPQTGPRHAATMWAVIGLVTLAGPVAIVLLRRVIEGGKPKEAHAA